MEKDYSGLTPANFPTAEDDQFEFKSSRTTNDQIKDKVPRAVSAIANSGGGILFLGLDGSGNADGGISPTKGKQSRRDWLDNIIHDAVKRTPTYDIKVYDDCEGRGHLNPGNVIVAVIIPESPTLPHAVVADGRYYIRAGAHTEAAGHFIVEALWAARHQSKPQLAHTIRLSPDNDDVIQLGVLALTDVPAVNVRLSIDPAPNIIRGAKFPLKIAVIDRMTPFFMDMILNVHPERDLPENTTVRIAYQDIAGKDYSYENPDPLIAGLPPLHYKADHFRRMAHSLEELVSQGRDGPLIVGPE